MQKILFGGYPRLCLCLIFPAILGSCAVKHTSGSMQKYMAADTAVSLWKIEVFMVPVKWMAGTPADELDFVLKPYLLKRQGLLVTLKHCNYRFAQITRSRQMCYGNSY